jgi:uncharacterized protein
MKIIIHDAASQKPKIGLNALLSKDTAPHREASRVFYAQMPLKNLEKSLYWFSIWAKSGDASSQLEVADILKEYPFMLMKNQLELRKEWLTLAANNGSAEAMLELGYFIRDNEGNDDAALSWYMKSANKGYARGQLAVGLSLIHKHDIQQAVKWLELAASQMAICPPRRHSGKFMRKWNL